MSTERDELASIIDDRWHGYGYNPQGAADAIIAAGYSKHGEELAKYKRGAKTLGEIIEKQCREVLDVTGLHHLINEDGDGAWDVVWMRLHEMRDELASLKESTIARERKRGDAWRDRAQEMDSRAQSLEVELQAAKPQQVTTAGELDAVIEDALEDARYIVATDTRGRPWIIWDDEDGCVQVSSWPQEEDPERLTLADIHLPATVLNVAGAP